MKFFQIIPADTNFDFIGKFKLFVVISVVSVGACIVGAFTKGFNFGIDFTGGTVAQVKFNAAKSAEEVRSLVTELGAANASVVALGADNLEYLITTRDKGTESKEEPIHRRMLSKLGAGSMSILQVDIVGPKVGAELKWAAIKSLVYSVILIMIYIWLRFDFRFAPGATIAMIHDIIVASGFYLLTGKEFTITAVAALLTIAGYSVNDTIVIYDRVRELLKSTGGTGPLSVTINKAINLTLSRTLLTSGVTFLSIIPIPIFCEGEIENFALAMLVGIFVGSYSTIYIAAPLTIYVERFLKKEPAPSRFAAIPTKT